MGKCKSKIKKSKSRAFTLIELLAIIVILAIIAVITVPIILNIVENSKKGAIIDSAYGYKESVHQYYLSRSVNGVFDEALSGEVIKDVSELSDVSVNGKVPSDGWVKVYKGQVVDYSLKFDEYVVNLDTTTNKPIVTKNGTLKVIPIDIEFLSGDKNTSGSSLKIGDEEFTVLVPENSDGYTTILTKTCLMNDNGKWRQVTGSESCFLTAFSDSAYWDNNNTLRDGYARDVNGNTLSNSYPNNYSGNAKPYIYYPVNNDTNNVKGIVDAYSQSISRSAEGRLLTYEEWGPLPYSTRAIGTGFWLGSVGGSCVYVEYGNGNVYCYLISSSFSVRPAIKIPTAGL